MKSESDPRISISLVGRGSVGHWAAFLLVGAEGWGPVPGLASHLVPQGTLVCISLCPHAHVLVSDLVICLTALWRDPLVCISLSCWGVDGAHDPASNQLRTLCLEALGPEGFCLGCWSCHGVPEDRGHVHDPSTGHDGGRDPCVPVHDVWAGKDWVGRGPAL